MECETYLVIHGTSDSENPITSPMAELYSLRMGLYNTVGDLFPGGMKELLVPSFVIQKRILFKMKLNASLDTPKVSLNILRSKISTQSLTKIVIFVSLHECRRYIISRESKVMKGSTSLQKLQEFTIVFVSTGFSAKFVSLLLYKVQQTRLASNLVIEHVLIRSLKCNGGLLRGTSFEGTQREIWLLSMPISSTFNLKMLELTEVYFKTSEQYKSTKNARISRDNEDIRKVLSYVKQNITIY